MFLTAIGLHGCASTSWQLCAACFSTTPTHSPQAASHHGIQCLTSRSLCPQLSELRLLFFCKYQRLLLTSHFGVLQAAAMPLYWTVACRIYRVLACTDASVRMCLLAGSSCHEQLSANAYSRPGGNTNHCGLHHSSRHRRLLCRQKPRPDQAHRHQPQEDGRGSGRRPGLCRRSSGAVLEAVQLAGQHSSSCRVRGECREWTCLSCCGVA